MSRVRVFMTISNHEHRFSYSTLAMVDQINDVWISDEEISKYDKLISSKDWERMNEDFGNVSSLPCPCIWRMTRKTTIGYKEGIIEGKDITIQEGFNKGYAEGASVGKEIGRLRGLLNTLLEYYTPLLSNTNVDESNIILPTQSTIDRLKSLESDLANLTVEKFFTKNYFKETSSTDSICSLCEKSESTIENCCKNNMNDFEMSNVSHESEGCLLSQQPLSQVNSPRQILAEYCEKVKALLAELGFNIN
ncbi:22198_t:CDS:2 [Cetraspora pellucida]|uniref:Protein YAE1 n=1 Tax=Cetraspora pellucida TaxID=1433469 RepID=A0A9N9AVX8_9GLOM|nr:22198_t:CDS:2 [Cetraspora pellucida]